MKKHLLTTFAVLALSTVIFNGCKDDEDTTPPVITLLGNNPFALTLNSTYSEPGYKAEDDQDGDVTGLVVVDKTEINKDKTGSYEVHYEVTDAAGNFTDFHRTVNVSNSLTSSPWTGNYSCVITEIGQPNYTYSESLAISSTVNNGFEWSKFGDYSNATAKLNISIDGSGNVSVPTQSFTCGTPAVLRQFSGSGTSSGAGAAGSIITLQITETVNAVTKSFVYTYTKQ